MVNKIAVSDWDTTALSNTDLNGGPLGELAMYPAGVNNAFREVMAEISRAYKDASGSNQTVGGTANAITLTINQPWTALVDGQLLAFKNSSGPNTTATTITVSNSAAVSLGLKKVRGQGDTALVGGEMLANGVYWLRYVATYDGAAGAFVLLNPSVSVTAVTTFLDSVFRVQDNGDATKQLAFELAGFTTATTRTLTPPNASGVLALIDLANQVVTGGGRITSNALGTIASGTVTLDPGTRPLWDYTNGGAHILLPGSNNGSIVLDITNNGSAGVITVTGWTKVVGAFTTTNGHKFRCSGTIGAAGSLLSIQALQ